jgi:hypothetical protein
MGKVGCGKTALLNKICNTNFKSGEGVGSVTRGINEHQILYQYPFYTIDTPGINST